MILRDHWAFSEWWVRPTSLFHIWYQPRVLKLDWSFVFLKDIHILFGVNQIINFKALVVLFGKVRIILLKSIGWVHPLGCIVFCWLDRPLGILSWEVFDALNSSSRNLWGRNHYFTLVLWRKIPLSWFGPLHLPIYLNLAGRILSSIPLELLSIYINFRWVKYSLVQRLISSVLKIFQLVDLRLYFYFGPLKLFPWRNIRVLNLNERHLLTRCLNHTVSLHSFRQLLRVRSIPGIVEILLLIERKYFLR